ncbi:UNVERIFIED_CONTAM: WD repeat-containing protein 44 [Sesamum latifolium]|uniref:WD repeat-containing protein 44 n=1 Tax=Sesamum latifolium TaxID=2727402 RepID=A0AAW2VB01_9LAMI
MQCARMNRRTLTMDWDGLGDDDDDDRFFESNGRISSVVPVDFPSSGSDEDDDFEDSRMSFVSAISSTSFKTMHPSMSMSRPSSMFAGYDMWTAEPGDIRERRKRLLQGMGLSSTKDMLRIASTKLVRGVSGKHDNGQVSTVKVDSPARVKFDSSPKEERKRDESSHSSPLHSHRTAIVLVRSRSDGDIDAFSARTKQRKEELIGPVSKQRLTRTSSGLVVPTIGVCQYPKAVRISPERRRNRSSNLNHDRLQSAVAGGAFGSFFLIKNLDTGKEFIVKEYNEQGMWNKLSDVQTGKQLTMEEFEKSVGYSPVVKELMGRQNVVRKTHEEDGRKINNHSYFSKSFRNSKRKGAAILKNIKGVATSMSLHKEHEHSSHEDHKPAKATTQWVKARQHGKSYKELTALHMSQEIQAHEGSVWTIKFSCDARFLASAGEDKVIHVWEVQECEVAPTDTSSVSGTPVHPMACIGSDRSPVAELTPIPSEKKKKKTVFALSEKPVCTFKGHQEDVLDLSWSKSQLLLSSSMDKTVRMWDLETKSCVKMFAHNDYVTCIQFNPVDDDYFLSGSLDGKVRIWSIPDRHVVDWTDLHEMVTAASYTPDGQGAIIGSHQGVCRIYSIDDYKMENRCDFQPKIKAQTKKKLPGFQSQPQAKKVTGFQFTPWDPSEVLITSADSRIRIYSGSELIQKYRGFRNTNSQISASFSPDGRHVISASEDSQVYIWKVAESKNPSEGKRKCRITVQAHEHFHCKDVSVAIPWPSSIKNEPPMVEIHSKRHLSKRSTAPPQSSSISSPTKDNLVGFSSRRHLPPLPKKDIVFDRTSSCADEDFAHSSRIDPGIGVSDSFASSSASINYYDSDASSPSRHWSSSDNGGGHGGQTVLATAWGLVIVTASLQGEIRVYQNFGLPLKVGRPSNLF